MFAGGVGAVGLLPPLHPPHASNEPIAIAIASHFILASNVTIQHCGRLYVWISWRAVL
jgi:hypothetical protein